MNSRGKLQVQMVLDQDRKERIVQHNNNKSIKNANRDLFYDNNIKNKQPAAFVPLNNPKSSEILPEQILIPNDKEAYVTLVKDDKTMNKDVDLGDCSKNNDNQVKEVSLSEFSGNLICTETIDDTDDDKTVCEDDNHSDDASMNMSSETTQNKNDNQVKEVSLCEFSGNLIWSETFDDTDDYKTVCEDDNHSDDAPMNMSSKTTQNKNLRRRKKQTDGRTPLVDYSASEEENKYYSDDSASDPSFEPHLEYFTDSDDDKVNDVQEAITRWRKRQPSKWKVNIIKSQRSKCLPYYNKNKECPAKLPKHVNCTNCRYDCSRNFTEADRTEICRSYWALADNKRQKDFLVKSIQTVIPKRRKVNESSTKARAVSKVYYLQNSKGRFRVCANFFQKTLCISNGPIDTAIRGVDSTGVFQGIDKRGRKPPGNKTTEEQLSLIKEHIESFPSMESHYVRQSSKKKYLDCKLSILKMYELYKDCCRERNSRPVSEFTYRRVFCTSYNLSFFKPKKDQCPICTKYETVDVSKKFELELEYTMHIIRKNECNAAKVSDKERCLNDPTFLMTSFDLQSVLQLPYSDVSQFYYSRKICVYNLTFYEGDGTNAYCYCWNELNGKRGSNEVGSILLTYITKLPSSIQEISFFSDTCGGQNRNQQVAAALLYAVKNSHIKIIHHKFLESGHTHMECDAMHSAIENAKRNQTAFVMNDWIKIFKSARKDKSRKKTEKGPYQVMEMKYSDFKDLHALASSTIKNRNKDEDGNSVTWLKIKCLKFDKKFPDAIFYRYDHCSEYKKICVAGRGRRRNVPSQLLPAYNRPLPISKQKKEDLVKLCRGGLIPDELHGWYQNLHTTTENEIERLPEPNETENENESD